MRVEEDLAQAKCLLRCARWQGAILVEDCPWNHWVIRLDSEGIRPEAESAFPTRRQVALQAFPVMMFEKQKFRSEGTSVCPANGRELHRDGVLLPSQCEFQAEIVPFRNRELTLNQASFQ